MNKLPSLQRSTTDLVFGQEVIVYARWLLVATAMMFALWNPLGVAQLRIEAGLILLVAMGNFFLHAQVLRKQPTPDWIVYAASAADLVIITALTFVLGGFAAPLYVFYFPAVLAYSVAFGTETTLIYTLVAIAGYGMVGIATAPTDALGAIVVIRCLMIAAVAFCGNEYMRLETRRLARTGVVESRPAEQHAVSGPLPAAADQAAAVHPR